MPKRVRSRFNAASLFHLSKHVAFGAWSHFLYACVERNPMCAACLGFVLSGYLFVRKTLSWLSISAPAGAPHLKAWPDPTTAHVDNFFPPTALRISAYMPRMLFISYTKQWPSWPARHIFLITNLGFELSPCGRTSQKLDLPLPSVQTL